RDGIKPPLPRYPARCVADPEKLGARANRGDMLIAPAAVFETQARDGRDAVLIEPDALGLGAISAEVLGIGHFYPRHQIDDDPNLLALGCIGGWEADAEQET